MTDLLLRDGKILIAGNGRGLSAECDCCDEPPPPPRKNCDDCCFGTVSGDIEVGDSVLIDVQFDLPAIRQQFFSPEPGDNGIRKWDAVSINAQVALDVTSVNVNTDKENVCLEAAIDFFGEGNYSDISFLEVSRLRIYRARFAQEDDLSCIFQYGVGLNYGATLTLLQDIKDLGEEATIPYAPYDFFPFYINSHDVNTNLVVLTDDPCSNQLQFPLFLKLAGYNSSQYPIVEVIGPQVGDEVGKVTILGVG